MNGADWAGPIPWVLASLSFLGLLAYAVGGRWRTPYERAEVLGVQNRLIALALLSLMWVLAQWAADAWTPAVEESDARSASGGVAQAVQLVAQGTPLWWAQVACELLDWARYAAAAALLLYLLHPGEPLLRWRRTRVLLGAALVMLGLELAAGVWRVMDPQGGSNASLLPSVGAAVLMLTLLEQAVRNADAELRWAMTPLGAGLALTFGFDLYRYAQAYLQAMPAMEADPMRVMAHALGAPLVALSVRRHVGSAVRVRMSRTVVMYTGAVTIAGVYMLLMAAIGTWVRYFEGQWSTALQTLMVAAGLLALGTLAVSRPLRARVRVTLTKHFFAYRYDYRDEWLRFTALLSAQGTSAEVGVRVVQGLATLVNAPSGSLWLKQVGAGGRPVYARQAQWNEAIGASELDAALPVMGFLAQRGWVIDLQEWKDHPARYEGLALPTAMTEADGSRLVVPLTLGEGDLQGFVLLREPDSVLDLDWEVRDLLKTAARQAASYLAYMTATSELLEARKFEAFNRMSAFVVHDLKNIVTQLSLMMRNAQRLQDNPAFRADMLMTVDSSVEKMRRLMAQLREGAADEAHRPVDVGTLLVKLKSRAAQRGRTVEIQTLLRVFTRGSRERLERVLGHLLDNAMDATPNGGRVWLHMCAEPSQVCVEVGDTGQGMSEAFIKERLFRAFSSTKAEGMGIGLHESLQYVRELGGRIEPHSAPGQGTVMKVWLPLLRAELDAPLSLDHAA